MSSRIVSDPARVFAFCKERMPVSLVAGMKGLGLERDGELVAGVLYEGYNHHNIWMHVAAEPGKKWLNREFLRYCFHYPFVELGCNRVSGYVEAQNADARRCDAHLGFQQEAVLQGAASDGGDVILYVMRRDDCRYLEN
jgi:RimJ/RimL family protein N-acetyltransferase